jgi:DNA adenine methylase
MAIKPFLKWVGGKTQIIDTIINRFPKKINNYYEPFLGGGSVMLRLLEEIKNGNIILTGNIIVSDINETLISLYNFIKTNPNDVYEQLIILKDEYNSIQINNGNKKPKNKDESLTSKESYYYWCRNIYNNNKNNDINKAVYFLFLNKTCFRGLYREGPNGFNVPYGNYKNPEILNKEHIMKISDLIQNVEFKCCNFNDIINDIKSLDFIYFDPPYLPEKATSFVSYVKDGFNCHKDLFDLIKTLKCNFVMSNANVPLIIEEFKDYKIDYIMAKRSINSKNPDAKTKEVIVYNNINKLKNKGTGAGGANTNFNGLAFEKETELNNLESMKRLSKNEFLKYFNLDAKEMAHGTKQPDEVYVDEKNKVVFILEKKFQNGSGSVCEKLQTGVFKKEFLKNKIPSYKVEYIYIVSDYLIKNCSIEIEYLNHNNIPVFNGNSVNYKEIISDFIKSYFIKSYFIKK